MSGLSKRERIAAMRERREKGGAAPSPQNLVAMSPKGHHPPLAPLQGHTRIMARCFFYCAAFGSIPAAFATSAANDASQCGHV